MARFYLDRKATGVIDDALANPGDGLGRSLRGVAQHHQGGLVFSRLPDAVDSAKALFLQLFALKSGLK